MNGREVIDNKYEKITKKYLAMMPEYMNEYYYYLSEKTALTRRNYIEKVYKFFECLKDEYGFDLDDISVFANVKPYMISKYLEDHIIGEGSAKATVFYAIKNFFSFLESADVIERSPTYKMTAPKDKKVHEITYLTNDEIKHVINNIKYGLGNETWEYYYNYSDRDLAVFATMVFTGLRRSSIRALNLSDLDLDNRKMRIVEKGNKQRYIVISQELVKILQDYLESVFNQAYRKDEDALFLSNRGKRITNSAIEHLIKVSTFDLDKHITAHKLRSTYATAAIKKTGNIYLVANQLGHANVKTTARYAAVDDEMKEIAASVMDDLFD